MNIITLQNEDEIITTPITDEEYDSIKLLFFNYKCPCKLLSKDVWRVG